MSGIWTDNEHMTIGEGMSQKSAELWSFTIKGKIYQVTEHQKVNPLHPIWDDFFCVSIDGVVLERRFESVISAMLYVLKEVRDVEVKTGSQSE